MTNQNWLPVVGYEGYYEVSDLGLVRSVEREIVNTKNVKTITYGVILRPKFDKDCYLCVELWRNCVGHQKRISNLVATAFIPNPENKPIADHQNGIRWDNRAVNLKWMTQSENIQDAFDKGRKKVDTKAVNQLDRIGNFVKRFESIEATKNDGFNPKSVSRAAKKQRPTYSGFVWEYAK